MSCLAGALCAILASDVATTARPIDFGGSNHWLYAHGTADGGNTNQSWYLPALNLRPTLGTLEHDPGLVHQQMIAMRKAGQTTYVLPIYNKNLFACELSSCNDGLPDGVYGDVVDSGQYAQMRPQHRANLQQIVTWAVQLGFERIVVRFFANGDPQTWAAWDEVAYQRTWNFIVDAHESARSSFGLAWGKRKAPSYPVLVFDIGAEQAGVDVQQMKPFIKRLWSDYVSAFGTRDTLGFSFAWEAGRFETQRAWLEETGLLPETWAFDVYIDVQGKLDQIYAEMGSLRNQPIHILETYYNDPGVAQEIANGIDAHPLMHIESLVQWPLYSGAALNVHFSEDAVDGQTTTETFSSYAPLMAARKVFLTSDDADVIGISDVSCGATVSLPCAVELTWGAPPAGKNVGVYSRTSNGLSLVHCEGSQGSSVFAQMGEFSSYDFEVYFVDGACVPSAPNAGAQHAGTAQFHF